jgi:hypothetical protein
MRNCTVLTLLAISVIVVCGGCGGEDIPPKTLTGDFFPLATGAQWTYDFHVETYYGRERADANAVSTRNVENNVVHTTGTQTAVAIDALRTSTVTTSFPALATPPINFPAGSTMRDYAEYLFAADGGLQNYNAYFESRGHGTTVNRIVHTASGTQPGPAILVPSPQPYLRVPLVTGDATDNSVPFVTMPFFSNNETLSGRRTTCGIQWRAPENILGTPREWVTLVQHLQANIAFQGSTGACTGVVKNNIAKDCGPFRTEADLEFKLASEYLRLHVFMNATNYTP